MPGDSPEDYILSKTPRFCAVRLDDDGLDSVTGMSGGPIFGMRKTKEGKGEYTCIAVQGSELKQRRMVFGTPLTIILAALKEQLDVQINKSVRITKIDAVRRQLKAAVRLFFEEGDPVAVQTLASAAFSVMGDVYEARQGEALLAEPGKPHGSEDNPVVLQHGFFTGRHADPGASIQFDPFVTEALLVTLCELHMRLTGEHVPLFMCFLVWCKLPEGKDAFDQHAMPFFDELAELHKRGDRPAFITRFMKHGDEA